MRSDEDFAIIMDNDVLLSGAQDIQDILQFLKSNQIVIFGTAYPKLNIFAKILGRKDYKPEDLPNIIFSILDLSYYKKLQKISYFSDLLRNSGDVYFDSTFPAKLSGAMRDTGDEVAMLPLLENKKYYIFSCQNTFHPYYPGNLKHYLLGGDQSPEIYTSQVNDLVIHHFKKLSNPALNSASSKRRAYKNWQSKVLSFNNSASK
jgi:hypothetical protein